MKIAPVGEITQDRLWTAEQGVKLFFPTPVLGSLGALLVLRIRNSFHLLYVVLGMVWGTVSAIPTRALP